MLYLPLTIIQVVSLYQLHVVFAANHIQVVSLYKLHSTINTRSTVLQVLLLRTYRSVATSSVATEVLREKLTPRCLCRGGGEDDRDPRTRDVRAKVT